MANTIALVSKFLALIAEIYKLESKTADLDAQTQPVDFGGANEVKVMKLTTVGLGNYSRILGYPAGDITVEWVTMALAAERGRAFTLDRMDNEESLGLALGNLIRVWMRDHVAPEIDAYRFAKWATGAGLIVGTPATITDAAGAIAAFDEAVFQMDEAEVPEEGRILYGSTSYLRYLRAGITRTLGNDNSADRRLKALDDISLRSVPQNRFKTAIVLNPGNTTDAGGYSPAAGAKDINFMMLHPNAVLPVVKLDQVKYFSPDVNQLSDGHLWQYRLYHDAFVMENHEDGIYLHRKA